MSEFAKRTMKTFLGITAVFLLAWPLLDLAVVQFITHAAFQYSIVGHVITPIIFASLYTMLSVLCEGSAPAKTAACA